MKPWNDEEIVFSTNDESLKTVRMELENAQKRLHENN